MEYVVLVETFARGEPKVAVGPFPDLDAAQQWGWDIPDVGVEFRPIGALPAEFLPIMSPEEWHGGG